MGLVGVDGSTIKFFDTILEIVQKVSWNNVITDFKKQISLGILFANLKANTMC